MSRTSQHPHVDAVPIGIRWRAAIVAAAVALTYVNSLHGPFILDDTAAIVENDQIRDLSHPAAVLLPESDSPIAGRPLVSLSFALNYAAGGLDVRGYHAVNVAIHLVCALLIFGIIRRTLELPRQRRHHGGSIDLAFAAALLWAVHPLNSEVVDYVTQRSESMMAALYLFTLYAANRALAEPGKRGWQILAIVSCGLGMLCKESMATAPVIVALYDRVFAFTSWKEAFARRSRLYVGLAATWLVLAGVVTSGARSGVAGFSSGVSAWTYLLNQTVVITHYLRLSIWPRGLVVFYGWPEPVTLRDVFPYALLISTLFAATLVALVRTPAIGLCGAWFFLTLAPASSVVPVATEVGAERRMYLPLIAIAVLIVVAAHTVWTRWMPGRRPIVVPAIVLLSIAGALAATTVLRNREYASPRLLAQTVVDRRPTGVAYHILGEQLMLEGRDAEAAVPLSEAVARGDSRAGLSLGIALINQRRVSEAIGQLEAFVHTSELPYRLVPRWLEPPRSDVVAARMLMGRAFAADRQWSKVAEQAELVLKLRPSHEDARRLLAEAMINLGFARVVAGDVDGAVADFRRAVDAEPSNVRARDLLALALSDQQRLAAGR